MKRLLGYTLATGFALVVAASACVENKGTLFVQGVMLPPVAMAGAACIYDPQPTSTLLLYQGRLDIAFTNTYVPVLLMANEMFARGSKEQVRIDSGKIQLQGDTVRLTEAGGPQLACFTALGGGFVESATGTSPGYGVFAITVIDPDTVENLLRPSPQLQARYGSKRVIAYIKPYGQTLGGLHVEAGEFLWPIEVCNGCLVSFPVDAQDPLLPTPNCLNVGSGSSNVARPCFVGQDQAVDCRLCPNNAICTP